MVGTVGLEPTRDYSQRILSPLRLPIPPRPHFLEVPIGFEPMITELQSIALPLGYGTMCSLSTAFIIYIISKLNASIFLIFLKNM